MRSLLALLLLTSGCSSTLLVDGRPFEVKECSSGQAWGFVGVDLIDQEGRRMFVARLHPKGARVTLFQGDTASIDLGQCGAIDVDVTEERNEPYLVSGSFDVDCSGQGHTVKGGHTFSGCR